MSQHGFLDRENTPLLSTQNSTLGHPSLSLQTSSRSRNSSFVSPLLICSVILFIGIICITVQHIRNETPQISNNTTYSSLNNTNTTILFPSNNNKDNLILNSTILNNNDSTIDIEMVNQDDIKRLLQEQFDDIYPAYIEEYTTEGHVIQTNEEKNSLDEDLEQFPTILALKIPQQKSVKKNVNKRRHIHGRPSNNTSLELSDKKLSNKLQKSKNPSKNSALYIYDDEDHHNQTLHEIHQKDVTLIHNTMKKYKNDPFVIDYHSIIKHVSQQFPTISGNIHSANIESNNRYHAHLAHSISSLNDMELFHSLRFFHISDTHIDAFFSPYQSSQPGVCSSCYLNDKIYKDQAYCPIDIPFSPNIFAAQNGYNFGRLRCNPPPALLASMLAWIRSHEAQPSFFLVTGDLGAHGMPTDKLDVYSDGYNDYTDDITDDGDDGDENDENVEKKKKKENHLTKFCPTKFIGMRNTLRLFKELFPHTPILFSPGNNDHLPKNIVYRPYFEAFAALLLEFDMLHPSQALTFARIGSHYVDLEIDNVAYHRFLTQLSHNITFLQEHHSHMHKQQQQQQHGDNTTTTNNNIKQNSNDSSKNNLLAINPADILRGAESLPQMLRIRVLLPDMTLFSPHGEPYVDIEAILEKNDKKKISLLKDSDITTARWEVMSEVERENIQFPLRGELVKWFNTTLSTSLKENRLVLIAGHQPLSTKKGNNELLLQSTHGILLKSILSQYSHIIRGSFFGHRNLASVNNILAPDGSQIIPSLVIPGVSPRGNNLPAIHEVSLSRRNGVVLDFEQYVFNLIEENEKAQRIALGLPLHDIDISETHNNIINNDDNNNKVHINFEDVVDAENQHDEKKHHDKKQQNQHHQQQQQQPQQVKQKSSDVLQKVVLSKSKQEYSHTKQSSTPVVATNIIVNSDSASLDQVVRNSLLDLEFANITLSNQTIPVMNSSGVINTQNVSIINATIVPTSIPVSSIEDANTQISSLPLELNHSLSSSPTTITTSPSSSSPSPSSSSPSTDLLTTESQIVPDSYYIATNESIPYLNVNCNHDRELCQFVKKWGYLGKWEKNVDDVSTWRKMTGYNTFTAKTVSQMNDRVPRSSQLFTALEVFKHASLIGDETPENVWCKSMYDDESMMMTCLFPEQNPKCWAKSWVK